MKSVSSNESGQAHVVQLCVDVPADPDRAFTAFTAEMDLWWVRGPINFYDAARAVAMRCEPCVGARILELYGDADGDALELAHIITWEPGRTLAWQSSLAPVVTQVRFLPLAGGTRVTVEAHWAEATPHHDGTAIACVAPAWFDSCFSRPLMA